MSFLPDPALLARLGFVLTHTAKGHDPSTTHEHPGGAGVVCWPAAPPELRLYRAPNKPWAHWCGLFEGSVPDEAAFLALLHRHFPDIFSPAP